MSQELTHPHIAKAKEFRRRAKELLEEAEAITPELQKLVTAASCPGSGITLAKPSGIVAQHILSIRKLEEFGHRQGEVLAAIGSPNPYPTSRDPSSTVVHPPVRLNHAR